MTLICIECRQEFDTLDAASKHTNPLASKDVGKGTLRISLKKHVIFKKSERTT
jgi:hypothetical protein